MSLVIEELRSCDLAVRRPEPVDSMLIDGLYVQTRQENLYTCPLCHKGHEIRDRHKVECPCGITISIDGRVAMISAELIKEPEEGGDVA